MPAALRQKLAPAAQRNPDPVWAIVQFVFLIQRFFDKVQAKQFFGPRCRFDSAGGLTFEIDDHEVPARVRHLP